MTVSAPMSSLPEVGIVRNAMSNVTVPESWAVEQIDSDGDGGIDVAVFSGPNAKARAQQWVDMLRLGLGHIEP